MDIRTAQIVTWLIVGAIVGWNLFTGSPTDTESLIKILSTWIACPILAGLIGALLFKLTVVFVRWAKFHLFRLDAYTRLALILAGAFGSYALGANNIANVMGVFLPSNPFTTFGTDGSFTSSQGQRYRSACDQTLSLTADQWHLVSLPCDPGASDTVTDGAGAPVEPVLVDDDAAEGARGEDGVGEQPVGDGEVVVRVGCRGIHRHRRLEGRRGLDRCRRLHESGLVGGGELGAAEVAVREAEAEIRLLEIEQAETNMRLEAAVEALRAEGERVCVEAEQAQDRRLQVVHVHRIADDIVAELAGLAVAVARPDPAAGQPEAEP